MRIKFLLALAVGGFAAWQLTAPNEERRARRLALAAGRKPPAETTWEDEGGALRESGSQLGPAPELP